MELKELIDELKRQKDTFGVKRMNFDKDGLRGKAYTIGDNIIRIDIEAN